MLNIDLFEKKNKTPLMESYILSKKLDAALAYRQIYDWAPYTRKPLPRSHPINLKLNRPIPQSQIRRLGLQCSNPPLPALAQDP